MASRQPFNVQAVNPRYKGAWMSDVALALVRPEEPEGGGNARSAPRRVEELLDVR